MKLNRLIAAARDAAYLDAERHNHCPHGKYESPFYNDVVSLLTSVEFNRLGYEIETEGPDSDHPSRDGLMNAAEVYDREYFAHFRRCKAAEMGEEEEDEVES